jgi:diacylglycerol kinase (CTP)
MRLHIYSLSWSDTAASTIGRLLSPWSSPLPDHVPILGIPFARRKSLAGFLAACVTGFCIGTWWWWNGKNVDGGWGDAWGGNRDLIWWTGERLGSWRFLNAQSKEMLVLGKPIRLWMTASVLGVVGAVVEAIGELLV